MGNDLLMFLVILTLAATAMTSDSDNGDGERKGTREEHFSHTTILSRRKRALVFPDGSSFQLVFCTENMGYLQIDLVWFGNTAALAWELPSDPSLFYFYKNKEHYTPHRRGDVVKNVYYLDDKGKLLAKVPYRRKFIVNPAFAKRSLYSIDGSDMDGSAVKLKIKNMHENQISRQFLKTDGLPKSRIEFHRNSRKDLYAKVEKMLSVLGWNGRQCVLRMLCESNKNISQQGNFIEEILHAVFTLPRGRAFDSPKHQKYDEVHLLDGDCAEMYSDCRFKSENMPLQFTAL